MWYKRNHVGWPRGGWGTPRIRGLLYTHMTWRDAVWSFKPQGIQVSLQRLQVKDLTYWERTRFDKRFSYSQGHNKVDAFDGDYPQVHWAIWLKKDVWTFIEDTGSTMDAAASSGGVTRGKAIETHPTYWQRPMPGYSTCGQVDFGWHTLWKVLWGDYNPVKENVEWCLHLAECLYIGLSTVVWIRYC
jgi:hypothetical protein